MARGFSCGMYEMKSLKLKLGIMPCREGVILPEVSKGNAGIDLRVLTGDGNPVEILPNKCHVFPTGIKMNIPEGYYIEVVVRSSVGIKKHLRLMNTLGVLDSSWKGETLVALHNFGEDTVVVDNNERVCQMIIHKVEDIEIERVDSVGESDRGEKGIGSTGRY